MKHSPVRLLRMVLFRGEAELATPVPLPVAAKQCRPPRP